MIKGNSVIECGISDLQFVEMQTDVHHFIKNFNNVELNVDMEREEKSFVILVFKSETLYNRIFTDDEISVIRLLDLYQYIGE